MSAPGPIVSVVVPTRDRPSSLAILLAALEAQTLHRGGFEVIVVDDGSQLPVAAAGTRLLRHAVPRGPAAARNTGWRAASAPLIAFTDDDCVPEPGWLEALVQGAAGADAVVVQGVTMPARPARGLFERTVRAVTLGPQYPTCNIAYPRAVLEALGGFDERYGPRPTAEDTDLAWRALARGLRARLAPEAVVHHAVTRIGPRGQLAIAWRWGGAVRVFADHPGARAMLYRRRWWNVWHYLLWRSLLACLGPAWLRRLVVARHVEQLRRRAGRAGTQGAALAWAVPWLALHDAVECVAVARGALRAGVLVL